MILLKKLRIFLSYYRDRNPKKEQKQDFKSEEKIKVPRREFKDWPQTNFGGLRILLANTPDLREQGFSGAREEEFEKTIMIFPEVKPWPFNMEKVVRDLKIAYLDESYKKLGEGIMVRETGTSDPPEGAKIAIEGLP